jgi:hypothetical protein
MAELLARRRTSTGNGGKLLGLPSPALRHFDDFLAEDYAPVTRSPPSSPTARSCSATGRSSSSSGAFEEGINPGVEVGRFLSERLELPLLPRACGGKHRVPARHAGRCAHDRGVLEEFISNEDDGWSYVVDALTHGLEEALAHRQDAELRLTPRAHLFTSNRERARTGHTSWSAAHLEWASLLGQRTAELHAQLTSDHRDPNFAPRTLDRAGPPGALPRRPQPHPKGLSRGAGAR